VDYAARLFLADPYHQRIGGAGAGRRLAGPPGVSPLWPGRFWLAAFKAPLWARTAAWFHLAFGVCLVGTAAFSHHPWLPGVPFDPVEDFLHSLTATVMGFAFALGVVVRFWQREKGDRMGRLLDVTAVAAATFLPLLMATQPEIIGLLQRLMFGVAYLWYGREALA
jgi:hypothetical protein